MDLGKDPGGLARSMAGLKAKAEAIARADSQTVRAAGLELERAIKLQLSHPGSGAIYGNHQASAPGEPPAPDDGVLRNSVGMEVVGNVLRVGVSDDPEKVVSLEWGNLSDGGFIAARPFMRPALESAKARMTGVVFTEVQRGMR